MAAIYNLCNISNDLAEGKTTDEMLEAAAQEIRRATTALIVAYRVEGDLESSTLKELNVSEIGNVYSIYYSRKSFLRM